jgi:apolipoprotein D and lipocalin family protein
MRRDEGQVVRGLRGAWAAWVVALACSLAACASPEPPLRLAGAVDMEHMYGGWYIVANIPNRFEDSLVGLYDVFSPRADGDIQEDFYTFENDFSGPRKHYTVHDWVVPGTQNAAWRVQLIWPLHFAFQIIYVDPAYRYALFAYPDRTLGWIYSRTPELDEATYQDLLGHFRDQGFDTTRFRHIVQMPSQFGLPDYLPAPAEPHP